MTATRWWVRLGARWVARIDSVKSHLSLAFQAMSGVGIASGALKYYGLAEYVAPFLALTAIGMLVYARLYSEGGVWNQVQRDKRDLSNNFAGPNARISNEMLARALRAAEKGDQLSEGERQVIKNELDATFFELRDGVDLEATND